MKRSKFNLSHYKLGSADMGFLYPISCYEALPGDTIQQSTSIFLRFAPMLSAVMHPVRVSEYTFAVPIRLLYEDFEDFITGGPDGLDVSVPPSISITSGVTQGSLNDYLGVPPGYTGSFSKLPFRAYNLIWNEYFRDQDLTPPRTFGTGGGHETAQSESEHHLIARVSWEKDYFTTCRPWPQKGAEVNVPVNGVSGTASITISGTNSPATFKIRNFDPEGTYPNAGVGVQQRARDNSAGSTFDGSTVLQGQITNGSGNNVYRDLLWDNPQLTGTFNNGSAGIGNVRLDDLREAFALQRFEEARAMYGSRYTEYLRYLGVRSSDARLQRPEYLGGSTQTVQFSEVLQTAADGTSPVGTLRGHGIGASRSRRFRRFIEEHSIIMTLMCIRPIAIYQNGLNRMFSRETKEDYWQKELQHVGQQEVFTRELYALADNPDDTFGYQNRYDEYRSVPSTVAGEMRSTLNYWHLARDFASAPVLNTSFVYGSPTKRVFAEQTMNEIYFMAQNSVVARRLLSKSGNPIL